jgi:hypothetical protein
MLGVTGRQYEAVAVQPVRIGGVIPQPARVQPRRERRQRHGRPRMTGSSVLDGVGSQEPDRVDRLALDPRREARVIAVPDGDDVVAPCGGGGGGHGWSFVMW